MRLRELKLAREYGIGEWFATAKEGASLQQNQVNTELRGPYYDE